MLAFEDSKTYCEDSGGFLLEIRNQEVQDLIENIGRNASLKCFMVWLNLVRTKSNVWVWNNDEPGQKL